MHWPAAYLITFRTYGTWLPGDERTWIDDEHNTPNTPPRAPTARLESHARRLMRHDPVLLNAHQRMIVDETIRTVAIHRSWVLHALNVRTNHVHVVARANSEPELMMNTMKVWSTRRLRAHGLDAERIWARHGSTRYLWGITEVEGAITYVRDGQQPPNPDREGGDSSDTGRTS